METHRCPHGKPCPPVLPGEACEECERLTAERDAALARDFARLRAIARLYDDAAFDASDAYFSHPNDSRKHTLTLALMSAWNVAANALRVAHGQGRARKGGWFKSASAVVKEHMATHCGDLWIARVCEDVRRRIDEGYDGPLPQPDVEDCPETFQAGELVMRCALPLGHGGAHVLETPASPPPDQTPGTPAGDPAAPCGAVSDGDDVCDRETGHAGNHSGPAADVEGARAVWPPATSLHSDDEPPGSGGGG